METIELKDVMNQLPVVEDLKNFAGIDAQNALSMMTPERLAAVVGGNMLKNTNLMQAIRSNARLDMDSVNDADKIKPGLSMIIQDISNVANVPTTGVITVIGTDQFPIQILTSSSSINIRWYIYSKWSKWITIQ